MRHVGVTSLFIYINSFPCQKGEGYLATDKGVIQWTNGGFVTEHFPPAACGYGTNGAEAGSET